MSNTPYITTLFEKAQSFVAETDQLIRTKFNEVFSTESKSDSSLVTEVDLAVEKLLRKRIQEHFPDHGIVGEEGDDINSDAEYQWILDPIDGTQSFFHRVPTFGTLLAVNKGGQNIVGIISHPALSETYAAAKGLGCFCNGQKITIVDTGTDSIDANEIITLCSRKQWLPTKQEHLFDSFWQKHNYFRIYYDCFSLSRAVAGQIGCAVEMNVKLWDIAPCQVLIEEAGGSFFKLSEIDLGSGLKGHSVILGKPSVVKVIKNWFGK
jgi:histidinol-phosphatase